MDNLIYKGTIVEVVPNESKEANLFLLVECFDGESLFQVVRLDGYHRGSIEGYIKFDEVAQKKNIRAIRKEFLIEQFKKYVVDFENKSFKIIEHLELK